MTSLLLGLLLCWDPFVADGGSPFWKYEIQWAERHITGWVACPTEDNPLATCPTYNPFNWNVAVRAIPSFSVGCADSPGDVCYYKHPTAWDTAGNESLQPMLLWPPPFEGGCP